MDAYCDPVRQAYRSKDAESRLTIQVAPSFQQHQREAPHS